MDKNIQKIWIITILEFFSSIVIFGFGIFIALKYFNSPYGLSSYILGFAWVTLLFIAFFLINFVKENLK